MAQGDAQRQWFAEMKTMLQEQFSPEMSWAELALLAERLDATLQQIRKDRNILPPMFTCPKCGVRKRAAVGRISVNAVILAAGRFDAVTEADAKEISKRWEKHRKKQGLDLYGRELTHQPAMPKPGCQRI